MNILFYIDNEYINILQFFVNYVGSSNLASFDADFASFGSWRGGLLECQHFRLRRKKKSTGDNKRRSGRQNIFETQKITTHRSLYRTRTHRLVCKIQLYRRDTREGSLTRECEYCEMTLKKGTRLNRVPTLNKERDNLGEQRFTFRCCSISLRLIARKSKV